MKLYNGYRLFQNIPLLFYRKRQMDATVQLPSQYSTENSAKVTSSNSIEMKDLQM
jgi:hypothetical protein